MKKKTTPENFNPINSEIAEEWHKKTFGDLDIDKAIGIMFPPKPNVKVWEIDKVNRTLTIKMTDLNKEAWKHLFKVAQEIRDKKLQEIAYKKNND